MSSGRTLAIIGVGLIGGSLGLSWRAAGFTILGVDEPAVIERALERGAIDQGMPLGDALAAADVVVLCVPVAEIIRLAGTLPQLLRPGQIVTDVGGVKGSVVAAWEEALEGTGAHFIGGHPMFGREVSGIDAAERALASGARYILTPNSRTPQAAVDTVRVLATTAGATVALMSPEEHDRRVAVVSHLPQVVATALAAAVFAQDERHGGSIALAAGGFRDTTRIASSPAHIWTDVLLSNREAVRGAISAFREALDSLEGALERGDAALVAEIFRKAQLARERLT